jgi:hypothetical protein
MSLETFTQAYITCALWTFDNLLTEEDIHPETMDEMKKDCRRFYTKYSETWSGHYQHPKYDDDGLAGHDFWLTRNRHGAGFWDRGFPDDIQELLTKSAHAFGEYHLWIGGHVKYGNDNMIHGMRG